MTPSPEQIRAARALLEWTQEELAANAKVGIMTLKRLEMGQTIWESKRIAITQALIAAGIVFIERGDVVGEVTLEKGVAVRLTS